MNKNVVVLGSTGFIGRQALQVVQNINYSILGVSANSNIELLEKQIRQFKPICAVIVNEKYYNDLKLRTKDLNTKILSGMSSLLELIHLENVNVVFNAIIGIAGLEATLETLKCDKTLALANKESLVVAGELILKIAEQNNATILPVDSEHSAIFQCLTAGKQNEVKKLILTASGGPFFKKDRQFLKSVKISDALKHPNWNMGKKITIDSATLINKGLEIIEAKWLFNLEHDKIEVLVHPESIIHSMVEYVDNNVIAQLGVTDMRSAISYALTYPNRKKGLIKELNFKKLGTLSFFDVDEDTFKGVKLARAALDMGGLYPCALSCANEQAVELFLKEQIKFTQIDELVEGCIMNLSLNGISVTKESIIKTNYAAREFVLSKVNIH